MKRTVATISALTAILVGASRVAAEPEAAGDLATGARSDSDEPVRRRDATWGQVFAGPFQSSRLFAMPTARVVGAYQLSMSGDASLLSEVDVLSTSGVVAIGFGDIAQLEYRNSSAITTLAEKEVQLPALGVQLKIPYRPHRFIPELAVALRFGLPQGDMDSDSGIYHEWSATDLYLVGRLAAGNHVVLHGGLRASFAEIESEPMVENTEKMLFLPTLGIEFLITDDARLVGEIAQVPLFDPGDATEPSEIRSGIMGRGGVRWRVLPWMVVDASFGYRIEVERLDSSVADMARSIVDWDIRLGGEIVVPWGAVLCRTSGLLCK